MKLIHFFFFLCALSFFAGCSDSNTSTSGTSGEGLTGGLYGTVALVDYRGRPVADSSGVLVQYEGTTYSAISASDGSWVIHNLPTRTYSISFSKAGYSTVKYTSFQFFGGGAQRINSTVYLYEPCRFTLTVDGMGNIYSHSSADAPDSLGLSAHYLFGRSPAMDPTDPSTYVLKISTISSVQGTSDGVANFSTSLSYSLAPFQTFSRVKPCTLQPSRSSI